MEVKRLRPNCLDAPQSNYKQATGGCPIASGTVSDETPAVNSRSRTVSREFISESANLKIFFFYPISRNRRSQGFEHAFSKRSEWKTNFSNFCVIMEKLGEIRVEDDFSRRRSQILHDAHSVNDPLSGNA